MATTNGKRPQPDPAPTATELPGVLRRFVAAAFPDSPGAAAVIVPAPGLPAVVLPLAADAVPGCIGDGGVWFTS